MTLGNRFFPTPLAVLLSALFFAAARPASADLLTDTARLTANPHRLTGTDEYRMAAEYVAERLREIGVDEVIVQEFPAVQTVVNRCEMVIHSGDTARQTAVTLLPMRPNGIVPASTGSAGVTGTLMFGGNGTGEDYGERSPRDCIVVLNYNSGDAWLRAFRLGARAVIFARQGPAAASALHYLEAQARLPRFFYPGNPRDLPYGSRVTIHSEVTWQNVTGRNVFGVIKGTSPVFSATGQKGSQETAILAANLDSFGEVPRFSPGARGAANCAALLEIAKRLEDNPPRRNVVFAFFDNQARGHMGVSAFYRAITEVSGATVEERMQWLRNEQEFNTELLRLLDLPDPLGPDSPARQQMLVILKRNAESAAYSAKSERGALNEKHAVLRREIARLRDAGTDADRLEDLEEELTVLQEARERIEADFQEWNDVRRALAHGRADSDNMDKFRVIQQEALDEALRRGAELVNEARVLAGDQQLANLFADFSISLHISLLLGDATQRWGLLIGGDSDFHSPDDNPGLYGAIQNTFIKAYTDLQAGGSDLSGFEAGTADGSLSPAGILWAAPQLVHSGEICGFLSIFNVAIGTAQEGLSREGTPDDTLANLAVPRIASQVQSISRLLREVLDRESLSIICPIPANERYNLRQFTDAWKMKGATVLGKTKGSSVPNKPLGDAVVQFRLQPLDISGREIAKFRAFDNFQILSVNENATYAMGPVPADPNHWFQNGFALVFDAEGIPVYSSDKASVYQVSSRLNCFECHSGSLVLPALPAYAAAVLLEARSGSALPADRSYFQTRDGTLFWFCELRTEGLKFFGLDSLVGLNSGPPSLQDEVADVDQPYGKGFEVQTDWRHVVTAARSAADLWRLDEARMEILRERGVMNSSVEELHGRAQDLMIEAQSSTTPGQAEALATSSFLAERRVYSEVRGTLDDLVHAVLVLLALSVPFAFALERLLIGTPNVYRQIGWFMTFFALTFGVLYFTHPAFAIAPTPMIIFLGFAIVVLATLVIAIIMRKFEYEIKVFQGLTSTIHAADVSRMGTVMAAMSMGISTMRRRPLRTGLTAVTIILLTFTILCFASFGSRIGVVRLFSRPPTSYSGVYLHKIAWGELPKQLLELLAGRWGNDAQLTTRYWLMPVEQGTGGILLSRADGAEPVKVRGVCGLDQEELERRPDLAKLLGGNPVLAGKIFMTVSVADYLGVKPGDTVLLRGQELVVGAMLDAGEVAVTEDMDGSNILPVDFTLMVSTQPGQTQQSAIEALESTGAVEEQNWAYLPVDSVVFVSADTARQIGGTLRAVTLYTDGAEQAAATAEEMARILPFPVIATRPDGVYRHVLGSVVQASGARDLFFPIVLGALVIFGTMLGSVADREREIYTFSALGLAPAHVASLFLAEAMAYSVIGGMSGYLLAQVLMKLFSLLASLGLMAVPEMNYSSTNAIVTLLIVMGTVLLSAIYPALKASRSANPGILRTWRLPPPTGDTFDLVFPFTVSEYDITGVASFLKEHFGNYADTGLGSFMARDVRLVKNAEESVGLDAFLALAPFDLGVTEAFQLRSAPSEIAGIDEVKIRIVRQSGQYKDWQRLNKVLLNELRRQFLIWRSLPHETMEFYRRQTLEELREIESETAARANQE